jgi:ribosomal protein S12 methylthiotransferase accessory factor
VDITVRHSGGKKVTASTDKYTITTDQTVDDGGDASAPAPFDLFLASIATCAGHYVYEFCQKRDIPVDEIELLMNWERDEKTRMITLMNVEIRLPDSFPRKYEKAIVRAADLCSVKKHIVDPPEIRLVATYK